VKTLGIDTALGACSVALLDGANIVAHAHEEMQRGHAEALAPMTERVMRESGFEFSDLERIAVTTGPGTFTGQRVGLAFARAMALALKIPAVGVTTLDVMAEEALASQNGDYAIAVSDAKRGEVYITARSRAGEPLIAASVMGHEAAAALIEDLYGSLGGSFVLAGTGAELMRLILECKNCTMAPATVAQPDARFVARLGAGLPAPAHAPKPLYLRAPDAKLPKRAAI
jgi:tRNA threonylcarbamoyladenosine biosynthesis protein TsaB